MDSSPRWGWLVGSFVLFVAALLFKAVAVSLPVVLLILDVYPLRRFGDGPGRWFGAAARRAWWEKVPFVMVSLVFMGLAIAARSAITGSQSSITTPRRALPRRATGSGFTSSRRCYRWTSSRCTRCPGR